MAEDIIRVLRVIEYIGPRSKVEKQVANSLHGTKEPGNGVIIRAATIGAYPEVLKSEGSPIEPFVVEVPEVKYHG
jgi:hypothetical protein